MPTTVTDARAILSPYIWNGFVEDAGPPAFISYSFELAPPSEYLGYNYDQSFKNSFRALSGAQQQAARSAFGQWDAASGVTFFEVPSGLGDLKLASFDFDLGDPDARDAAAYEYDQFSVTDHPARGIIYVNTHYPYPDVQLFLHEAGHALGLKHSFEGDFVLPAQADNYAATVMSYTSGGYSGDVLGYLDRIAIEQLYGTNATDGRQVAGWSWNAATYTLTQVGFEDEEYIRGIGGNNIIDGHGGDDVIDGGNGSDLIRGGEGADDIYGYGGNDHLYGQSAEGGPDGDDTIRGGDGGDYIQGNAGADLLLGGAGSDRIQGGRDDDTIDGGEGNDSINGNLGNDSIDGGAGNDSLRGGQGNDRLSGGSGNNVVQGDLGDDTLVGGAGFDLLYGGDGADVFVVDRTGLSDRYAGAAVGYSPPGANIMDFQKGVDHIQIGVTVTGIATGTAGNADQAGLLAMSLLSGQTNLVAIAVGQDSYLYFSGGPMVAGYFDVKYAAPSLFDAGDFI